MPSTTKSHPVASSSSLEAQQPHGQWLRERVDARQRELVQALAEESLEASVREDIESAIDALDGLLTGDLEHISPVVAAELNTWLERHKFLAQKANA